MIIKKLPPIKAIRKFSVECVGSNDEVKDCKGDELANFETGEFTEMCNLFEYRFGFKPEKAKVTPLKAIKKECLFCMSGRYKVVCAQVLIVFYIHIDLDIILTEKESVAIGKIRVRIQILLI